MAVKQNENFKIIAKNKRSRFDYEIIESLEVGIILTGSEVKSVRSGKISINESFIGGSQGSEDLFLFNADIPAYRQASYNNHEPRRPRILLLHRAQKIKFLNATRVKGFTITPLTAYFNHKGIFKLSIALAKGKNVVDKRETIKRRDWTIEKARVLRNFNKSK
ncbi:MAG: SsrA-binding protein SmpB [Holosporales bacterium]|jgi:SsrA-binding protein|nr:SsrA-binding protein SmpB [Holosporales bacterium]